MDVSSSVDAAEDQLQRAGVARALIDPAVEAAFFISPDPVSLFVFEWSGRYRQRVLLDWQTITTPEDLFRAAQAIGRSARMGDDFPTAMGYALGYASTQFARVPDCESRTIDLAGDGVNNEGFGPASAYAAFPFDGVTVNGLVVQTTDDEDAITLPAYFRSEVIRGPGAFTEIANGFADYENAMRRKLLRELTSMMLGGAPQSMAPKG